MPIGILVLSSALAVYVGAIGLSDPQLWSNRYALPWKYLTLQDHQIALNSTGCRCIAIGRAILSCGVCSTDHHSIAHK